MSAIFYRNALLSSRGVAYPSVNHSQCLFEALVFCCCEFVVGLHVERRYIKHHLDHSSETRKIIIYFTYQHDISALLLLNVFCVCVFGWRFQLWRLAFRLRYLALVGKSPDSSCHLDGKYDKQEEEELHSGKIELDFADGQTTCMLVCTLNGWMCRQVTSVFCSWTK